MLRGFSLPGRLGRGGHRVDLRCPSAEHSLDAVTYTTSQDWMDRAVVRGGLDHGRNISVTLFE